MGRTNKKIRFYNAKELEIVEGIEINHDFPKHTHEKNCIGLVKSGALIFEIKEKRHCLKKGDIYLINSGEEHRIIPYDESSFSYLVICFSSNNVNKKAFQRSIIKENELCYKVSNLCNDLINNRVFNKEELSALLVEIDNGIEIIEDIEILDEKISSAKKYISENTSQKVYLDTIARDSYISKYHFLRIFEKKVGLSPHKFHVQQKIKLSKKMIIKGIKLTKIGLDLGFADQSHFIRTFKKYIGITPKEYRKSYEELKFVKE